MIAPASTAPRRPCAVVTKPALSSQVFTERHAAFTNTPRPPIRDKTRMYELLRAGQLGNTLQTWNTPDEFVASGFAGRCSLRSTTPRMPFLHGITPEEALVMYEDHNIFCEAAPEEQLVFQGEVHRGPYGLDLWWTTERANLRVAMRTAQQAQGASANVLLRDYVDASSLEDLLALLELYPDHVVEFATFASFLGAIPGRRTVIWEVRLY